MTRGNDDGGSCYIQFAFCFGGQAHIKQWDTVSCKSNIFTSTALKRTNKTSIKWSIKFEKKFSPRDLDIVGKVHLFNANYWYMPYFLC